MASYRSTSRFVGRWLFLVASWFLNVWLAGCQAQPSDTYHSSSRTERVHHRHSKKHRGLTQAQSQSTQVRVPVNVYTVLAYVRTNGRAPNGHVGGRRFGNFENHLPRQSTDGKPISYQEWDVNPKVKGQNRGAERLITGSDGRAYYTRDHYNSFTEIK